MKGNNNTDSNNQRSFYTENQDKNKLREKAKSILNTVAVKASKIIIVKAMTPGLSQQYAYDNRENNANINENEAANDMQGIVTDENIVDGSGGSNRSNCFKHFWDYICCCCKRKKPSSNKKFENFMSHENNIELNMITQDKDTENCDDKILIDPPKSCNTPACITNSDRDMSI